MNRILRFTILTCYAGLLAAAPNLQIYFIDVEGGAATLIIGPAGEALLADAGSATPDDRDARRIFEVTKLAGLKKLDFLLTTHFDSDHVGGTPALAKLIRVERFLDHGDSIETSTPRDATRWQAYLSAAQGKRTKMKPGDRIPIKGARVTVASSNAEVLSKPINGGRPNQAVCQTAEHKKPDVTENERSLGFLLVYGKFKFLDLGDLTWEKEMELTCPVNKLGKVTLYQPTWHGFFNDASGPPAHLMSVQPQVVVVNNGPRKGIATSAIYERIAKIPGIEGIWQMHKSLINEEDKGHNTSEEMMANLEPTADCRGHWLKVTVEADGRFSVINSRNNFSRTYAAR